MSNSFEIPLHPNDLTEASSERYSCNVDTVNAVAEMDVAEQKSAVSDLCSKFKKNAAHIVNATAFDTMFGFVRGFSDLDATIKSKVVSALETGVTELLGDIHEAGSLKDDEENDDELTTKLRSAVKMYCFLIQWNIQTQELLSRSSVNVTEKDAKKKGKKSSEFNWEPCKEKLLGALSEVLKVEGLGRLWNMGIPQEEFVGLFVKTAENILESASNMKNTEIAQHTTSLLADCLKNFSHPGVVTGLKHLFFKLDHVPDFCAQFAQVMHDKYEDGSVAIDFIREMADVDTADASRDSTAKNIQSFIESISEKLPRVVLANFPLLAPHFDGEAYMIRNALVTAVSNILIRCLHDDLDESMRRTRDQLLEMVLAHEHDVKSYTRSRVLQSLSTLCQKGAIPKMFFLRAATAAYERMNDKAVAVRKSALGLLTMLLQNNPYGSHFNASFYEEKHQACNEALQAMLEAEDDTAETETEAVASKKLELEYYSSALSFIAIMTKSMESVSHFLGSSTPSDVQEAINFVTAASEFGLTSASIGVRKMMLLIFTKDDAIKEAVIGAFERIYLKCASTRAGSKAEQGAAVAQQLVGLLKGSNVAEQVSIEECARELQKQGLIRSDVRDALWQMVDHTGKDKVAVEDARVATKLLSFFASGNGKVIRDKVKLVLDSACSEAGWRDPLVARYAIAACQRAQDMLDGPKTVEMVASLIALAEQPWCVGSEWSPALEQMITHVFANAQAPLETLGGLIKKLLQDTLAIASEGGASEQGGPHLTKLFFVIGHVALETLVYCEEFDRKVKKRRHEREKEKAEAKEEHKEGEDLNEELGMSEADEVHEAELLQKISEGKIVGPGTVLGDFEGLLVAVCASDEGACDLETRTAAIMALCKCMCISQAFCDHNLRLLFTILQSSKSARIRAMVIVALGDMAFRFPNLLEPWNEKMYERLTDPEACVRKNTLLVMSHLILNDMIKAKGHIAHIATCLEDEDPRIQDVARLFWDEFAHKQNAIYNVIPDMISKLSVDSQVDGAAFQRIMKRLMSYIEKDKQSESLIEKLCHRIRDCKEDRVGKDLVFCMAQLNYSAKCVKKLVENAKCWTPMLHDKEVVANFDVIGSKAKRFAKEDMKTALAELEAILTGVPLPTSTEDGEAPEGETPKPKPALKPSRAANKKKGAKKGKSKVVLESDEEDDFSEEELDFVVQKENAKAAAKPARSSRRRGVAA